MLPLLLLGLLMIGIAVWFWSLELDPFLKNIYQAKLTKYEILNLFIRLYALLVNVYRFFVYGKYLVIDLLVTACCISFLGFGDAVSGGVLGLALSNCVSVLIIVTMKKQQKLLAVETNGHIVY